jgi:hypothetical protein
MKRLMTLMLGLSFLGATAMFAQVPAATPDTKTAAKKAKKAAVKKETTEKTVKKGKSTTEKTVTKSTKAPKAKKDTTTK